MSFANALSESLEARQMDIAELARKVDSSYEYIRQLTKGYAFPGRQMLKSICRALEADCDAMWNLVVSDKIAKKYGPGAYDAIGKNPRFLEIERLLPQLTEEQFQFILGAIEGIAKRNRVNTAPTANVQPEVPAHSTKAKYLKAKAKQPRQSSHPVHPGVLKSEVANEVKR